MAWTEAATAYTLWSEMDLTVYEAGVYEVGVYDQAAVTVWTEAPGPETE